MDMGPHVVRDGVELFLQWYVVDPGAGNPFFVVFSDGGHVTIG